MRGAGSCANTLKVGPYTLDPAANLCGPTFRVFARAARIVRITDSEDDTDFTEGFVTAEGELREWVADGNAVGYPPSP